jgi:hypothetical protein
MRGYASSLAFFCVVSLQAETPKLPPPDSARQAQALESIKRFALTRFAASSDISCQQVSFPGTAKAITMEFSAEPETHPGVPTKIDTVGMIQEIFAVSSATEFTWDHSASVGGRHVAAYRFSYLINGKAHAGTIYADENSGAVSRVTFRGAATPAHLFCSPQTR